MPRFSVIVPVYEAQAYLPEALDSVLQQSFTDLELIVVDDRSPDASGALVDEYAAADPRVRAVHLSQHTGPGGARNAGLAQARGDYLLFLDAHDTLTPGALYAVADRLKETGCPDVLAYDHARAYWTGETVRDAFAGQLAEEGPAPFALADRPGLLNGPLVVWNKAYRREFVEREGLTFPPGSHGDAPWTFPALLTAETIATLDRVCVHHRQRRRGNAVHHAHHAHHAFDVFDQYERVFAFLDAHAQARLEARPELARWRPIAFRRMVDAYFSLVTARGQLPPGTRAEFFRRARAHYRRYRTPAPRLSWRERVRHSLVRLGAHRTHWALSTARRLHHRARAAARAARRATRAALLRLHYRIQLRLPVRAHYAVFAAYGSRGHSCNPGAIEAKVRELAPHVRTAWIADPAYQHTIPTATRRVTPSSAAYWTALARAKYLVSNGNFDHRMVKRPGQLVIQTQHGTPLKRMGLDLLGRPAAARDTDFDRLLDGVDTWDFVLSSNQHSTLTWERVFPSGSGSGYTTLPYGYPRNDRFQNADAQEVARLREVLGIRPGSIAILYAPTHRDYHRDQHRPLDLARLRRRLGPRFTVLARAHHSYGAPLVTEAAAGLIDVSDHLSVESLCLASDALVTDYSSLMFDYANLDRPIVIHADDWEAYEAARGTYFDLRGFPPGAVARSEDELIDIFTSGHWRGSRSTQLRTAFRERFCPYDDGRAAERVVRHVFLGERAGLPPVRPLADRRPAPCATPLDDSR
ncbi:bifunctional glycosyltransferase/CDP-glycerol:glycerophosphate glycerophosphotransferase [Streptomyces apocyni]|uniref:bifunctional glycosyltransferase/CDP-glycerol:glycerophosphate glycerophosphotransferase n=1 Tax=Streptomyces apocyni TaxID=2654677 RepID=UPI0012EA12C3|nr:bifunctional glycosyltransferase family 2 protein/CDP-glycerol:glycerophosphate glycerophosphotransferase [Streptomyces apocyni]